MSVFNSKSIKTGLGSSQSFYEQLEGRQLLSVTTPTKGKGVYSAQAKSIIVDNGKGGYTTKANGGILKTVNDSVPVAGDSADSAILPGFQIEVRFPDNTLTASQKAIFTAAAARWQQIILGDQSNVSGNFFGTGTETIDDLVIQATGPAIDGVGNILGQAGPTFIRNSNQLPISGEMEFDSADIAALEAAGQFDEVVLHEMGHVLGLGSIWDLKGLLTGSGGSDPRFTGFQATTQYQAIFGVATSSVPVENTGGAGTANSHWRESGGAGVAFGPELMTGYLNGGVANPISRVTIAQFADLGYTSVNVNAFDVFTPPNGGNAYPTIASLSDSADPIVAGTTLTLTANSVVDSNGSINNVRFYRETNGIPGLQVFTGNAGDIGADTLLATDSSSAGGWTASVSTTGLANGSYTYYAQATDNQNLVSVNVSTTNTIGAASPSAAPGLVDLLAATDTGSSNSDNLTNRDNSTAAKNLQFAVSGTISGATVSLYSSGTFIGSAVASGTTTTVTTNGTVDLADGLRSITARQTESGKTESADSLALGVTIDTVGPTISGSGNFLYQTVKPRATFTFSESLSGTIIWNVATVSRTSPTTATFFPESSTSGNVLTLTFNSQPNGIPPNGRYTANVSASGVSDAAGNAGTGSTALNFFVLAGDANRDAKVDFNDFLALQSNFNTSQLDFTKGDFDYNGVIDFNDFLILQSNFGVTV